MRKKLTPETPVEDAYTRLASLYHFPFETPEREIKQVIQALFEAKSEGEYFERIKQTTI